MQNAGSLKKKRRRNLAKVGGLGTVGYDATKDVFDIHNVHYEERSRLHSAQEIGGSRGSSTRATRNPIWNIPEEDDDGWLNSATPPPGYNNNMPYSASKEQRPCLLSKNAMNRLQQICIVGALVWALPWKFNKQTRRIDRWSPGIMRIWTVLWFVWAIQNTILTGYQFYSFFARVQLDNGSYRPVFMNSFCVFWYLYSITLNTCMFQYREQMRVYINSLLYFNETYTSRFVIHLDGLVDHGKAILNCTVPCNFVQLCLSCVLFICMPYQPWYLYSYIYKPENPYFWLIPGALQEWVMAGQTVSVVCLLSWLSVAHGNSVEFWLMEAHQNNETGYTTKQFREPSRIVGVYRSLQVLTSLFNECIAPLAFPIMKLVNWTAVISCGFVLIRSMNHKFIEEFPAILTYPFGVIVCGSSGYGMLQISAEMYDIAASFLNSWSMTRNKDFRKLILSCANLRIYVRHFYYVTIATTITYFHKTFDYIIDCIVTFP